MCTVIYRSYHSGHIKRILNKRNGPFHMKYDSIFADQRQRIDSIFQNIKYEKDTLAREILSAKKEIGSLFDLDKENNIKNDQLSSNESKTSKLSRINNAHYIYRMLRPNNLNFFEEQTSTHLKRRMDELLSESNDSESDCKDLTIVPSDILRENEPCFTTGSYTLAVASLIESLSDDLSDICLLFTSNDLPKRRNSDRFVKLFEILEDCTKLKSNGSNLNDWIDKVWVPISEYLNDDLKNLSKDEIFTWLNDHLSRVLNNKKLMGKSINECLHILALPLPENINIEREIGYPLDKSCKYIRCFLSLFNQSLFKNISDEDINSLIDSLKNLGLRDWFKLKPNEIEMTMFGRILDDDYKKYQWSHEDSKLSILLIDTIARNKINLLDIESYSPDKLFYLSPKGHREIISETQENQWLNNEDITTLVTETFETTNYDLKDTVKSELEKLNQFLSKTPLEEMIDDEESYSNSIGPGKVIKDENNKDIIKWNIPEGSQFDFKRNCFVRTRSGIDPMLRLDRLRCFVVERKRMRTMTKEGRVYFIRVVVAVGDGNGYFGMGVGFGNDIPGARSMGIESALKNMYFIDFDPKECLTTPVYAREYGVRITILPRPYGSGIRINRKWLPLAYLIGLDNCRIIFHGKSSWITRMRALKRALESIYSRRTACNMTGKRYVSFKNPGDYTIHWPDAWFIPLSKEYKNKIANIKKRRLNNFKKSVRRRYALLSPDELSTTVPHYSKYKSPIEKFIINSRKFEYINTNLNKSTTIN